MITKRNPVVFKTMVQVHSLMLSSSYLSVFNFNSLTRRDTSAYKAHAALYIFQQHLFTTKLFVIESLSGDIQICDISPEV
ncbi:hypothetical protein KUTeg_019044 [Tegillarca granosa]|uniref:Uncharacterized protein n=1 Tax=Tegillarca granosa TaxID=220873 RepID=A0ABQ9EBE0_TEGGR|nr:hypothetical protein KUTeg_019044 [Tegillarca granosa]